MSLQERADKDYDAIIVGAGATGGLAAQELSSAGLQVLVLDAGWTPSFLQDPYRRLSAAAVKYIANPNSLQFLPHQLVWKGRQVLKLLGRGRQPVQTNCFAWERDPLGFVDDKACPYETDPETPFMWLRSRQIGGRMVVPGHGRQYYRLSQNDLSSGGDSNADWPLDYSDIEPWYEHVEHRLNLSGRSENLASLPQNQIVHPYSASASESELETVLHDRWPEAEIALGRYAPPLSLDQSLSNETCITVQSGAIARRVLCGSNGSVSGIEWFNQQTKTVETSHAPIVFLCASAFESVRLLLASKTRDKPTGLGNGSDQLGRFIMDHIMVRAEGMGSGLPDEPVSMVDGRCVYLPRFDLRETKGTDSRRGFGVQVYRSSGRPGSSYFSAVSFGEMAPRAENRMTLLDTEDRYGVPIPYITCRHSEADRELAKQQTDTLQELVGLLNINLTNLDEIAAAPGLAAHECGGARMGAKPADSVLNANNECWDTAGLYVTDGACLPTQGIQNPTLTIMALTARACDHVIRKRTAQSRKISSIASRDDEVHAS